MKTKILISGLTFVLCCLSCQKEYMDKPDVIPYITAIRNGIYWVPSKSGTTLFTNARFMISAGKRDSTYSGKEEWLNFRISLADAMKSTNITKFYAQWQMIIGGDGIADSYLIDSTANNFINIASVDTTAKRILGTFSIRLVREKRYPTRDTLRFTDGKFGFNYTTVPYSCIDPVIH